MRPLPAQLLIRVFVFVKTFVENQPADYADKAGTSQQHCLMPAIVSIGNPNLRNRRNLRTVSSRQSDTGRNGTQPRSGKTGTSFPSQKGSRQTCRRASDRESPKSLRSRGRVSAAIHRRK